MSLLLILILLTYIIFIILRRRLKDTPFVLLRDLSVHSDIISAVGAYSVAGVFFAVGGCFYAVVSDYRGSYMASFIFSFWIAICLGVLRSIWLIWRSKGQSGIKAFSWAEQIVVDGNEIVNRANGRLDQMKASLVEAVSALDDAKANLDDRFLDRFWDSVEETERFLESFNHRYDELQEDRRLHKEWVEKHMDFGQMLTEAMGRMETSTYTQIETKLQEAPLDFPNLDNAVESLLENERNIERLMAAIIEPAEQDVEFVSVRKQREMLKQRDRQHQEEIEQQDRQHQEEIEQREQAELEAMWQREEMLKQQDRQHQEEIEQRDRQHQEEIEQRDRQHQEEMKQREEAEKNRKRR